MDDHARIKELEADLARVRADSEALQKQWQRSDKLAKDRAQEICDLEAAKDAADVQMREVAQEMREWIDVKCDRNCALAIREWADLLDPQPTGAPQEEK